ncbi:MAG: LPS export ABC transporter permease LptG [bacterium]
MRNWTLFFYIGRKILLSIIGLTAILSGLILLIDMVESLREVENIDGVGLGFALKLTLLRMPQVALNLTPFIFLFGTIFALSQLNRRSEIAVMRSAGLSVWQVLTPALLLSLITGVLIFSVADPIASRMTNHAEVLKDELRGKSSNFLKVMKGGIWLRQQDQDNSIIIHAENFHEKTNILQRVTFWRLSSEGEFLERWDAKRAKLQDKEFVLQNATLRKAGSQDQQVFKSYKLPSAYEVSDLQEQISKPEAMSVWDLPDFIILAEEAGLPSVRYKLRYQELISLPLKLFAMVLIAAAFSLKPVRSGGTVILIIGGILSGFLLFIIAEISNATAEAQIVPVTLAAWGPAILAVLIATTMLLHTEDG